MDGIFLPLSSRDLPFLYYFLSENFVILSSFLFYFSFIYLLIIKRRKTEYKLSTLFVILWLLTLRVTCISFMYLLIFTLLFLYLKMCSEFDQRSPLTLFGIYVYVFVWVCVCVYTLYIWWLLETYVWIYFSMWVF